MRFLRPLIIIAGLVLIWQIIIWLSNVPHFILPAPARVAEAWWVHHATILGHAGVTLLEIALGLLFGALRQVVGSLRNAVGAGVDHIGGLGDRGDDVAERRYRAVEVIPELCIFRRDVVDLHRQVAAGQSLESTAELGHDIRLRLADVFLAADAIFMLGIELLLLLGVDAFWQGTFVGGFIILAVAFERFRRR